MFVLPGPPEDNVWRLGTAVTRKVGSAVLRNRVRRLIREFFRLHQNEIQAALDIVVVPKRRLDVRQLNLDAVREELSPLLKACAHGAKTRSGPRDMKFQKNN